jgi:hypothetical protein
MKEWWILNGYRVISVAAFVVVLFLAMFIAIEAIGE